MSDMSRTEAVQILKDMIQKTNFYSNHIIDACKIAIASLETDEAYQLEYESTIKNDAPDINVVKIGSTTKNNLGVDYLGLVTPQEPRCKDCKWWKDSDGEYRRGCGAESQCPINRKEVYEGNGYCFLYEPQESEDK